MGYLSDFAVRDNLSCQSVSRIPHRQLVSDSGTSCGGQVGQRNPVEIFSNAVYDDLALSDGQEANNLETPLARFCQFVYPVLILLVPFGSSQLDLLWPIVLVQRFLRILVGLMFLRPARTASAPVLLNLLVVAS